jgi:hypothetical protein
MITLYVVSGEEMSLIRHQFKEEKRRTKSRGGTQYVGVWEVERVMSDFILLPESLLRPVPHV